jgi:cation diffusion facilitator CzcD-associated flavoprotein CzcO
MEKMIPTYEPFCKCVTPSRYYLESFKRPNVSLVTDKIEEFTEDGILTADGKKMNFDVIVLATGYDVLGAIKDLPIVGKTGKILSEVWGDTPRAYLGGTYPGNPLSNFQFSNIFLELHVNSIIDTTYYPNWFCILGANSTLAHNSLLFVIECQISYIVDCVRKVQERRLAGKTIMELRPSVMKSFVF